MPSKRGKAQKQNEGGVKYPDELLDRNTRDIIIDTGTYSDGQTDRQIDR
jgi:hypothetical protein